MNFLVVILTFLLRLWPFRQNLQAELADKLSRSKSSPTDRQVLVWLPIVGWVIVVERPRHDSNWLKFFVVEVHQYLDVGLPAPRMSARQKPSRNHLDDSRVRHRSIF